MFDPSDLHGNASVKLSKSLPTKIKIEEKRQKNMVIAQ